MGNASMKIRGGAGFDAETEGRWQSAIYEMLQSKGYCVDGSGCDSDDALDVTLTEIEQALNMVGDVADEKATKQLEDQEQACNVECRLKQGVVVPRETLERWDGWLFSRDGHCD